MTRFAGLLGGLILCAACSTGTRVGLDETAALYHDDLRWGRLPAAEGSVGGALRAAFHARRRGWGTEVTVVDLEIVHLRQNSGRGTARVRVAWTRGNDSTDIRESVVEELWEARLGVWQLSAEAVIAGDPGVFAAVPEGDAGAGDAAASRRPG